MDRTRYRRICRRVSRAGIAKLPVRMAAVAAAMATLLPFSSVIVKAGNIEVDVVNGQSDLTSAGTFSTNAQPGPGNDLTFISQAYNPASFTLGGNALLNIGTLNNLSATPLTLTNGTAATTSTITLNGGLNSVSPTATDLMYVAAGGSLSIQNGSAGTLNLTLASSGNFDIVGAASIGSAISGSGFGFTKTGGGILTLSGANTFTGGTTISAGTLQFGQVAAMSATGSITASSGATLAVNVGGTGEFTNATSGNGSIGGLLGGVGGQGAAVAFASGSTLGLDTTNATGTISYTGAISNAGLSLQKLGTGALTLGGNITTGAAGIRVSSGTLTLSGTNTFTGSTVIAGGNVFISTNTNLGANTAPVSLNGGTLTTTAGITNTHPFTIGANGGTIDVTTTGQYFFNTANTLLGSGQLTLTGTGTLTVNTGNLRVAQTNSYSGNMVLQSGGTFEYGIAGAVASGAAFTINNQGELTVNSGVTLPNNITVAGGTNSVISFENGTTGIYSGTITLNANAIIGLRDWYNYATVRGGTISGKITGAGGISVNSGSGSGGPLTLSNTANNYQGGTTISSSTVQFAKIAAMPAAGAVAVNSGGTLAVNAGGTGEFTSAASGNGSIGGLLSGLGGQSGSTVTFNPGSALGIDTTNAGGSLTYSGNITNAGVGISKLGTGTLVLSGTETYTGATTVSSGTLTIGNGTTGALGNTAVTVNGGTLTETIANDLSGTASLTVSSGTATLSQANSFTGATNVTGTLQLQNANSIASSALTLNSGSTLQLRANSSTTFATQGVTTAGTGTTTYNINVDDLDGTTTGQTITLSGLGQFGAANTVDVLNLTGGHGYTLNLGAVNNFNNTTLNSNTAGVTLQFASYAINFPTVNYTLGLAGAGNFIFGPITGPTGGGFKLTPTFGQTGTVTLNGINTFGNSALATGTISSTGTLNINNAGAFGGLGTLVISAAATLDNTSGAPITVAANPALTLSSDFTFGGTNPLNLGTGAVTLGTVAGATRTITVNGTGGLFIGGAIGNGNNATTPTINITKAGTGLLILRGANTYTGTTTVSAGTLVATSTTASTRLSVGAARFSYAATSATPTAFTLAGTSGNTLTLVNGSFIGASIGNTTTDGEIALATGGLASASGSISVNVNGITGVTPASGTYTLISAPSGGLLNTNGSSAAYSLGTVYNASNFNVGSLSASDTAITIGITPLTTLTSEYWRGDYSGAPGVWAASDGSANSNWSPSPSPASTSQTPGSTTTVTFSATPGSGVPVNQGAMTLGAPVSIQGLVQNDPTALVLNNDPGNDILNIGSGGITMNSGAGGTTLNAPITLSAAQTWTNASSSTLTVGGPVANGGFGLIVSGTGNTTINGNISGAGALTKSSAGSLTLAGINGYTGNTTVNAGSVFVTGSITATPVILVGNTAAIGGAAYQSGPSTVTNTNTAGGGFQIGSVAGAFGYYNLSGGTLNIGGEIDPGGLTGGAGTFGQLDISGGTVNLPNIQGSYLLPNRGAAGEASVVNISGGTVQIAGGGTPADNGFNGLAANWQSTGAAQTTTITIGGSGQFITPSLYVKLNEGANFNGLTGNSANVAVLNLNAGGALQTLGFLNGTTNNPNVYVNFNGGTLKAGTATNTTFLRGLGGVYVNSGGGTIDNNGQAITIGQNLLAPSGSGVTAVAFTPAGSGYVVPPQVTFSGGGGTGATGYTTIDPTTGQVTGVVITNPGTGYTAAGPVPTLTGGGGTGASAGLGSVTTTTNVGGALTFQGTGITTLAGTNTFSGGMIIKSGTVQAGASVVLSPGTVMFAGSNAPIFDLNAFSPTIGLLAGSSTNGVITNNAAGTSTATLTITGSGTQTYSGSIKDGSTAHVALAVIGGTQILAGSGSYSGGTTVNAATLAVNGNLSNASNAVALTNVGSVLGGSGSIAGSATVNAGMVNPSIVNGANGTTLTLSGGLALNAGGAYQPQLVSTSSYDRVALGAGSLALGGALALNDSAYAANATVGDTFYIIESTSSTAISGAFSNAPVTTTIGGLPAGSFTDNAGVTFNVIYGAANAADLTTNDVELQVTGSVPEPASLGLVAMGAVGLLARRRRRGSCN